MKHPEPLQDSERDWEDSPPPPEGDDPAAARIATDWSSAHLIPPGPAKPPLHRRRWVQVSLAALTGLVVGTAGTASDANSSPQRELAEAEQARDQLLDEHSEAREELARAAARVTQVEEKAAAEQARLAAEARRLQDEAQRLTALAEELASREAALTTRESTIVASAAEVNVPPDSGAAVESASATAYYRNCSEARAAGAAPVRTGDPGYGSHLDRDGDGIGCE